MNKAIVDLVKPEKGCIIKSYAYVAISRCQRLSDLMILRDFDMSVLQQPMPHNLTLEMQRSQQLEEQALNNLNADRYKYYLIT
jgi:hypothetical protein